MKHRISSAVAAVTIALLATACGTTPAAILSHVERTCALYHEHRATVAAVMDYATVHADALPPDVTNAVQTLASVLPQLDEIGAAVCGASGATAPHLDIATLRQINWTRVYAAIQRLVAYARELRQKGVL